jgi:hypothetical protein
VKWQDIPVSGDGMDIRDAGPMFMMIEHAVLDDYPEMTPHQFIVYAALMAYTRSEGRCIPSIASLAKRAHIGTTATKEALNKLVEYGLIAKVARLDEAGDPTSNLYLVRRPSTIRGVGRQTTDPSRETTQGGSPNDPGWVAKRPLSKTTEVEPLKDIDPNSPWNESAAFMQFWNDYPKRVARPAAEKAFRKHVTADNFEAVISGLKAWTESVEWTRLAPDGSNFIPYAQKFLNQRYWENPPPKAIEVAREAKERKEGAAGVSRPYTREELRQRFQEGAGRGSR